MKKAVTAIVLTAVLLTACGKAAPSSTGHEGMNMSSPEPGGHTGHSAETAKTDEVKATFTLTPDKPQSKKDAQAGIQITDNSNKVIENFDLSHEKKMHLIVVSKDLSYFNHIHPDYKGNGLFDITTQFPAGGQYKLFADFVPTGKSSTTKSQWITVQGNAAKPVAIQPDTNMTKVVDGKEITLAYDPLKSGKETTLTFTIKDAATKKPMTNLQQYLGAVGHVVILSDDAEQYLHVHPMEEKATGPDAKFMTTFPKSGVYKIWGQFQHEGKVFTVPYVVKVP
ncbi:hypothetical protein [Paenibacillus sp. UNC451MF]|uniref:hypothetical protein n=1 Tax=Paenibacillus sp. UNC451MF TaxID=1449063 RepID=UPI000490CB14|nr:hypothetical protein [Paenibacillus sp. UNC451MF]